MSNGACPICGTIHATSACGTSPASKPTRVDTEGRIVHVHEFSDAALLDLFAGLALCGMASRENSSPCFEMAREAYKHAGMMIEARKIERMRLLQENSTMTEQDLSDAICERRASQKGGPR